MNNSVRQRVSGMLRGASRQGRRVLRGLGLPLAPRAWLVYHPDYTLCGGTRVSYPTVDFWRADRIIEGLDRADVLDYRAVLTPEPVTEADLLRVHSRRLLEELAQPQRLAELLCVPAGRLPAGEPTSGELLRPILLQVGGTVLAAERALLGQGPVINLGGGFHRAEHDRAASFSPLNDLAVAILRLRARGLAQQVLVIDLDFRQGSGTAAIFAEDEQVFTLSVHRRSVARSASKRHNLDLELPLGMGEELYLATVRGAIERALKGFQPELALYVAGAQSGLDDENGGLELGDEALLARDLLVLELLAGAHIPVAVVLGSGYGPLAWTGYYNFIYSVLAGEQIEPAQRPGNIAAMFQRIGAELTPGELRIGDDKLSEEELGLHGRARGKRLFMGYYTARGLEIALERYGVLNLIRERGFSNLLVSTDSEDSARQIARIHFDEQDSAHLLVELVACLRTLVTPPEAVAQGMAERFPVVSIEWLMMQNPCIDFAPGRLPLPGQRHPGLGLGRWMVELLRRMAERLECSGLMSNPQYYHNAYLYAEQMLFFSPEEQGCFEAMRDVLSKLPLAEASTAVDQGRLRHAGTGAVVHWEGKPQVLPVKAELVDYFARPAYQRAVAAARAHYRFRLERL